MFLKDDDREAMGGEAFQGHRRQKSIFTELTRKGIIGDTGDSISML